MESAFAAAERSGGPDVVVFRKSAAVQYDEGAVEKQHEQRKQLLAWWAERFGAPGEPVKRAWISFQTTDEFDDALEKWLESWLCKRALIPTGPAWSIAVPGTRWSSEASIPTVDAARPPCVWVAPFGRPVVPLV